MKGVGRGNGGSLSVHMGLRGEGCVPCAAREGPWQRAIRAVGVPREASSWQQASQNSMHAQQTGQRLYMRIVDPGAAQGWGPPTSCFGPTLMAATSSGSCSGDTPAGHTVH